MRVIGLDIHSAFAEAVAWDDGKLRRMYRNSPPGQLGNAPLYAAIVRCLRKPAALRQPSPLHDKIA
jgi:hypothetical protein